MKSRILLILIFSAVCLTLQAQVGRRHNKLINKRAIFNNERFSVTGGIGLSSYYGDLCDKQECMQFRPNLGLGVMVRLTDNIGFKTELNYFRLYSDDVWKQRNLDFRSNNVEFYLSAYAQLFPYQRFEHRRKPWNPYVFAGIGGTYFSTQGSLNGEWHNLRPLQTEGISYSPFTLMLPFGAGVSFHVAKHWDIMLELGYRKTFTDRLDDVSSKEWRLQNSFDNQLAAQISNKTGRGDEYWTVNSNWRGNPAKKDGYFISQVKVRYTIITKKTHYRLRRAPLRKRF